MKNLITWVIGGIIGCIFSLGLLFIFSNFIKPAICEERNKIEFIKELVSRNSYLERKAAALELQILLAEQAEKIEEDRRCKPCVIEQPLDLDRLNRLKDVASIDKNLEWN